MLLTLLLLFTSCSKKSEQYDLHIGDNVTKMDIENDVHAMENAFLDQVMPLWDILEIGESEWFSYSRTTQSLENTPKGELVMSNTSSLGSWRFFKQADGMSGIEQKGTGIPQRMVYGVNMNKDSVRECLKPLLCGFEPILIN